MPGYGWWDDFYSGFKMVVEPGTMRVGTVADALGQPEIGIPLQIISGLMYNKTILNLEFILY